jgi:glutaminase
MLTQDVDATVRRSLAEMPGPILGYLQRLHDEYQELDTGAIADYIPELGTADPSWFGICLVTADGHVYEVGDSGHEFTIQSISKPFVLGMALEDRGRDAVLSRIGVEPSGNPFNAIVVDEASNRPFNPMVNSGAIVATGLITGADIPTRRTRVQDTFARYVGHPVEIDEAVFESERLTGDRNRAIGYLMRGFGMLEGDCEETLDLYFQQCSLRVTCRDIATMAATLANRGINPVTGERALDEEFVPDVLSVMSSCGMYDYSGAWVYKVGIPAKSGVSGGIIGVLPGQLGIAVFSPPLDAQGNSVRGIRVCERISEDLALHVLRVHPTVGSGVRRTYRGGAARSNVVRPAAALQFLDHHDGAIVVHEMQGDLHFTSMESAFRAITDDIADAEYVILDFRRVMNVDNAARSLLDSLDELLTMSTRTLVIAHAAESDLTNPTWSERAAFSDVDLALEWCEDQLLARTASPPDEFTAPLAAQELLHGLSAEELAAIDAIATVSVVPAGTVVVREGEPADALYFVLSGEVSVRLGVGGEGRQRRLATFGPGLAFGEMALIDDGVRTADVFTDTDSTLAAVTVADLDTLGAAHPVLIATLLRNLSCQLAAWLQRANAQVRALDG